MGNKILNQAKRRWSAIKKIESIETLRLSPRQRLFQLSALIYFASSLGKDFKEDAGKLGVRLRWASLKKV
jgi:hypothetical protein